MLVPFSRLLAKKRFQELTQDLTQRQQKEPVFALLTISNPCFYTFYQLTVCNLKNVENQKLY